MSTLGLCVVCGGKVKVDGRTAVRPAREHDEWRVGSHGPYETSTPCSGVGLPTEPLTLVDELVEERYGPPLRAPDELPEVFAERRRVLLGLDEGKG